MNFQELNRLSKKELQIELTKCCGSTTWVKTMLNNFPFPNTATLYIKAEEIWDECLQDDWLEAFEHHPKIGDVNSLEKKFENTSLWASSEQSSIQIANQNTLQLLAQKNAEYEEKFGYIFIVCATGKAADEMLNLLLIRLNNNKEDELIIAKNEQNKITQLRLKKLLS